MVSLDCLGKYQSQLEAFLSYAYCIIHHFVKGLEIGSREGSPRGDRVSFRGMPGDR